MFFVDEFGFVELVTGEKTIRYSVGDGAFDIPPKKFNLYATDDNLCDNTQTYHFGIIPRFRDVEGAVPYKIANLLFTCH